MRGAGRYGKSSGYGDAVAVRAPQRLEQGREANVVAHGEAEPAERRTLHQPDAVTCTIGIGFAPAFAACQVDIEHVHLVVARGNRAVRRDDESAVDPFAPATALERERAERYPQAVLARSFTDTGKDGRSVFAADRPGSAFAIAIEQARHFGREQHVGAPGRSLCDRVFERCGIGPGIDARSHLQDSDACHSARQQRVELAFALERGEFVRTADMRIADEDLRHGPRGRRAFQHLFALRPAHRDVVFGIVHALLVEQALGSDAESATEFGVNVDRVVAH
jgi:hypothetical protein